MVRAKLKVQSIKTDTSGEETAIELHAVYDPNPESENGKFFKYTPSGSISLAVVNKAAAMQFEVGKEYFVDFTPAT